MNAAADSTPPIHDPEPAMPPPAFAILPSVSAAQSTSSAPPGRPTSTSHTTFRSAAARALATSKRIAAVHTDPVADIYGQIRGIKEKSHESLTRSISVMEASKHFAQDTLVLLSDQNEQLARIESHVDGVRCKGFIRLPHHAPPCPLHTHTHTHTRTLSPHHVICNFLRPM